MKTFSTKVALAALATAALLTGPAFAAKRVHQVNQDYVNQAVVADPSYGAYRAAPGNDIPGYDSQGDVVGISNPDQWH
jgi:hypothetical protein